MGARWVRVYDAINGHGHVVDETTRRTHCGLVTTRGTTPDDVAPRCQRCAEKVGDLPPGTLDGYDWSIEAEQTRSLRAFLRRNLLSQVVAIDRGDYGRLEALDAEAQALRARLKR